MPQNYNDKKDDEQIGLIGPEEDRSGDNVKPFEPVSCVCFWIKQPVIFLFCRQTPFKPVPDSNSGGISVITSDQVCIQRDIAKIYWQLKHVSWYWERVLSY